MVGEYTERVALPCDDRLHLSQFCDAARSALSGYPEERKGRMWHAVELRFGLDGGEPLSWQGVGEVIGVTRERARQIGQKAIWIMRHNRRLQCTSED